MYNFMQSAQLMFGSKVRYAISYKQNQPGFQVYTRKFYHNFKVQISSENMEGAVGANLKMSDNYIIAEQTKISIVDPKTFEPKQT